MALRGEAAHHGEVMLEAVVQAVQGVLAARALGLRELITCSTATAGFKTPPLSASGYSGYDAGYAQVRNSHAIAVVFEHRGRDIVLGVSAPSLLLPWLTGVTRVIELWR